jgi:hypothetical protein
MPINPIPTDPVMVDRQGRATPVYQAFLSSIHDWLGPVGTSGPTAQRPVNTPQNFLYIGQEYFDTTLGKPVWVKSLQPTVWCDATGAPV